MPSSIRTPRARAAAVPGGDAAHWGRRALTRAALAAGVLAAAAAGTLAAGAAPAAAATVLYAYAGGSATSPTSCPQDTASTGNPTAECSLAAALSLAGPGDTIALATSGGTAHYVGNWTVTTDFTADTTPITIEPAPGLASQPVLDGNGGSCSTGCAGPVLTVPSGAYVKLSAITIADGNNTTGNNASGGITGGGLDNAGNVTITGSTFTNNTAEVGGGAIDTGDGGPGSLGSTGSVTVTNSTFTGNSALEEGGGAINSGYDGGGGTVKVTGSTFTGNRAASGGAIANGDNGGGGTVTVTASTFTGNAANEQPNAFGNGGAIDGGDFGGGSVTVTASTFSGNTAGYNGGGGPIHVGGGTMQVAGDLFDGTCSQFGGGTWTDDGYNAGTGNTCFGPNPLTTDTSDPTVGSDLQTALTDNGGPTQTIAPTAGNPAITLIHNPATITLGGSQVTLCPATDQRGDTSAAGTACDAGAVQTTGSPATTTTTTTVSAPGPSTTGTAIAPGATLAGATGPGGTITYTVFGPQTAPPTDCTSGGITVGTPVTVTGNTTTPYTPSPGFSPASAGTYWWYASYTGTSGNSPSASGCGPGMAATTVTAPATPPDLSLANTPAPSPVVSGQPLSYTLTATNTGGQDATGVTVTDPLPASAVFGSMSATQGTCQRTITAPNKNKDGTVTCHLGTLPGGATATVTITVTPTTKGTLTATTPATVTATGVAADLDDSATAPVTVHGT